LAKKTVNTEISEVYGKLKTILIQHKQKIIIEEAPKSLSVVQGSVWGATPKTAQKKTTYKLLQDTEGTHVTSFSVLTSGYINLTLAGSIFSVLLLLTCAWIALNLQSYASIGGQGAWGWLSQTQGHFDANKTSILIKLTWISTASLAATLIVETGIIWNIRRKIDACSEIVLQAVG
jgi:hypothetical protein